MQLLAKRKIELSYYLSIATHSTASFAALSYLRVWSSYVDRQSRPKPGSSHKDQEGSKRPFTGDSEYQENPKSYEIAPDLLSSCNRSRDLLIFPVRYGFHVRPGEQETLRIRRPENPKSYEIAPDLLFSSCNRSRDLLISCVRYGPGPSCVTLAYRCRASRQLNDRQTARPGTSGSPRRRASTALTSGRASATSIRPLPNTHGVSTGLVTRLPGFSTAALRRV